MSRRTFNLRNSLQSNHNMFVDSANLRMMKIPSAVASFAVAFDTDHVDISWTPPTDSGDEPLLGYKIYKGTTSGVLTLLTSPAASATSYVDSAVVLGTTYYYKILAYSSSGLGTLSSEESVLCASVPGAPSSLVASVVGSNIQLDWTQGSANGSAVTHNKIYRKESGGSYSLLETVSAAVTYTDDSPPTPGITYYYKVTAVNAIGEGDYSNEDSEVVPSIAITISADFYREYWEMGPGYYLYNFNFSPAPTRGRIIMRIQGIIYGDPTAWYEESSLLGLSFWGGYTIIAPQTLTLQILDMDTRELISNTVVMPYPYP